MNRPVALLVMLLSAVPVAAQMGHDHATKVEGAGPLPRGWMGRTDETTDKVEDVRFVAMGSGWHVTSGPAAIYWNSEREVKAPFTASV